MDYRRRSVDIFLQHAGWDGAKRAPLAEDASFRRYFRLFHPNGETAMLMDAPPPQEDVRPFIKIAECLLELSFSAPRILHADIEQGFLLLEDFGDATYTQLLANDGNESELYLLATDTLIDLHRGLSGEKVFTKSPLHQVKEPVHELSPATCEDDEMTTAII